ncbi:hypothetical protein J6590_005634 [Homalodisca vitripennis]|nr:hypothetical protein J6590_005634 [Homalodisca vitripennis]
MKCTLFHDSSHHLSLARQDTCHVIVNRCVTKYCKVEVNKHIVIVTVYACFMTRVIITHSPGRIRAIESSSVVHAEFVGCEMLQHKADVADPDSGCGYLVSLPDVSTRGLSTGHFPSP